MSAIFIKQMPTHLSLLKNTFYAAIKICSRLPPSVTMLKNDKAKFKAALRKYLNTHSSDAVCGFFYVHRRFIIVFWKMFVLRRSFLKFCTLCVFSLKNVFILQNTITGLQCDLHCALSQRSIVWASLVFLSGSLRF